MLIMLCIGCQKQFNKRFYLLSTDKHQRIKVLSSRARPMFLDSVVIFKKWKWVVKTSICLQLMFRKILN